MILVCGGAGYIGSHTVMQLQEQGYEVLVLDDLSTGHQEFCRNVKTVVCDVGNQAALKDIFDKHKLEAVMHFCAKSLVGESVKKPLYYYQNNLSKSLVLLETMSKYQVKNFIFSSTAAVYGMPENVPIQEEADLAPINPYGHSKAMLEQVLKDSASTLGIHYVSLRYFNACGAWPEKNLGEWHEPESHLIPLILRACLDANKSIHIFGDDYDTPDGTCVRDYIHVKDLAQAHILALEYLKKSKTSNVFNLGTQTGFSVKQIIQTVENVTQKSPQTYISARRAGDPATLIASAKKANELLGWKPEFSKLNNIIKDAWLWEQQLTNFVKA